MNETDTNKCANICARYRRRLVFLSQTKSKKPGSSAPQAVCDAVKVALPIICSNLLSVKNKDRYISSLFLIFTP